MITCTVFKINYYTVKNEIVFIMKGVFIIY